MAIVPPIKSAITLKRPAGAAAPSIGRDKWRGPMLTQQLMAVIARGPQSLSSNMMMQELSYMVSQSASQSPSTSQLE
jgi:hypothetical protein